MLIDRTQIKIFKSHVRTAVHTTTQQNKKRREQVPRLPEFLIKPRSRVVWEKSNAKFTCTLQGFPEPRVRWCDANDSAQYRVFATNIEGKVSVFATLVVKSTFVKLTNIDSVIIFLVTDLLVPGIDDNQNVISIRDKFGVSFGTEGETLTLSCTVFTYPKEKHGFPIIQWWQDDQQLCESELVQTYWDGERATLVLACLNKDAEGLYTIRVAIPAGQAEHSAHVFVRDAPSSSPGVPPAPLDFISDTNLLNDLASFSDVGFSSFEILELCSLRCEEGSRDWLPCNSVPIVVARFPLMGLLPGCSYQFRVRAVGTAGTGRASQPTQPLVVLDPRCDLQGKAASAPYTGQITVTEEEPSDATVPGPPRELRVSESTRSFIILRWTPPTSQSLLTTSEAVTYYVEKVSNKDSWERLNGDNPIRGLQYAVLDVPEGKSFHFRVLACNSAGEGPASKACGPVSLTDWLPAPSAPENVQASRCSDSSVQLSWEASESRQGLLGYYIECRVVGETDWNSCHNKPITNTRFEVYGLKKGQEYEFRVHAVNATGFSNYSGTTEPIIVQAAIATPSPPRDVVVLSCTRHSMVLGWKEPAKTGGCAITRYHVDSYSEDGSLETCFSTKGPERLLEVTGLKEGAQYKFCVSAENLVGIGKPSKESEAMNCCAWEFPEPGPCRDLRVTEIRNDSVTLSWKCPPYLGQTAISGYFLEVRLSEEGTWRRVNESETSSTFLKVPTCTAYSTMCPIVNDLSVYFVHYSTKLIFGDPSMGDLGMYECTVDGVEGISASYTITEKGDILNFIVVPLKSGLAVELQDRGRVRLWTSAEHLSSTCQARCIFNDNVISPGQKYDIRIDRNAGLVEILMDRLLPEDEGSYSVQLKDGAAESETTLVFIGEGIGGFYEIICGPHFTEPLTWEVTQECNVKLFAKVGNIKNTTSVLWFKDDKQVMVDEDHDFNYGFCSLLISQITRRDEGVFSLELKDERGREITLLDLTMTGMRKPLCNRISPLLAIFQGRTITIEGLNIPAPQVCFDDFHRCSYAARIQAGVTENKIWIQIKEPTEKDKGHYTLELQAGDEITKELELLNINLYRGKVLGGLADVVTIMEGKSLNLTCVVSGEPVPEVCWLKGKQNMSSDERYLMSYDKDGYSASLIISDVKHEDTGEYHVFVRNKYGSDTVSFTVSVYLPGQELPSSLV
uniref:Myomesin 1 n=1 Tax=Eptatretus burgeri TaxID=7764 RepID=A0A8C4R9V6_EPTBU